MSVRGSDYDFSDLFEGLDTNTSSPLKLRSEHVSEVPLSTGDAAPQMDLLAHNSRHGERYWEPTARQAQPVLGVGALSLAISCMLVSLAILMTSNGQSVPSWTVRPTV